MGRLLLAVHNGGRDLAEFGPLEKLAEGDLGEAEMKIEVELAGLLEGMLQEIKNDEATPGLENSVSLGECFGGVLGMVESLRKEGQID